MDGYHLETDGVDVLRPCTIEMKESIAAAAVAQKKGLSMDIVSGDRLSTLSIDISCRQQYSLCNGHNTRMPLL